MLNTNNTSPKAIANNLNENQLLDLVRIAETTERYKDMCKYMTEFVTLKCNKSEELSSEERNLLSVAFKNEVGSLRMSWRTLANGFEDCDEELADKYKLVVETELKNLCQTVIDLLENKVLPIVNGLNNEREVYYLKMIGDYYRYLCEVSMNDSSKFGSVSDKGELYYSKAYEIAVKELHSTHPTRLGLALNYSVFKYEIANKAEKACELAKEAFDLAIENLDSINEQGYRDATLIMQLLRDNLTLWTSEQSTEEN